MTLTTTDHDRGKAGLTYVYPVLSRRAGGLSIGINLNINNACNWRCIYCQVPGLTRGSAPPVNMDRLAFEFRHFLADVTRGNFYRREAVPEALRTIKDIAISGNGEPATAREFEQVVNVIELVLREYGLLHALKCVLITNGSMMRRQVVKKGLQKLAKINGEVWFKIDSATPAGIARINQVRGSAVSILRRLEIAAALCPTWIQTCMFAYDKQPPSEAECQAYIDLLKAAGGRGIPLKGVMLYGVARQSWQPAAKYIEKLPAAWLRDFASRLGELAPEVKISP